MFFKTYLFLNNVIQVRRNLNLLFSYQLLRSVEEIEYLDPLPLYPESTITASIYTYYE